MRVAIPILLMFISPVLKAENPKYLRVIRTSSYIITQQVTLEEIKAQHPRFTYQVDQLQSRFDKKFALAVDNMESYLEQFMGSKLAYMKKNIRENITSQRIKKKDAETYLEEVSSRIDGKIPSPVWETLLSFNFPARPEREITAGFSTNFYLLNPERSTNWAITLPQSWKQTAGHKKGAVRDFISDYGDGLQYISFELIETDISETDSDSLIVSKMAKAIENNLPEEYHLIDPFKIRPLQSIAAKVEVRGRVKRFGVPTYVRSRRYFIRNKHYVLVINCGAGSINKNSALDKSFYRYSALFDLVAESVKVKTNS